MTRIIPLSPDVISQINSSKHITSLRDVAAALLANSLDAGATMVGITVDFSRAGCVVEDNGSGIPLAEFCEDGGLGKMYHTSKQAVPDSKELHGAIGTYLALLAALSVLSITACHTDADESATLTLSRGKVIARLIPSPEAHRFSNAAFHGTRVTVRDLFGSMPVRVKQRTLAGEATYERERLWHDLKRVLVELLLAWPLPCAVRLCDANDSGKAIKLAGFHPAISTALTEKSLDKLAGKGTKFDVHDSLPILFQAGLAPFESRSSWVPVSASTSRLSVKGIICVDPQPTKRAQFISIGVHPCSASTGHNELYDAVNKAFADSSFGTVGEDVDGNYVEKDRRKCDRRYKADIYTQRQVHGSKGVDRWPMFILQVKCSDTSSKSKTSVDMSDGHLKKIVDILEATVAQWLSANHFRRQRRRRKNELQQSPVNTSSLPSRPSSALSTLRQAQQSPGVNQVRKRLSTSNSDTASYKKRRICDLSLTPTVPRLRNHTATSTFGANFSTWSRIKSGRGTLYDELWQGKKPATAPEGQTGSALGAEGTNKAARKVAFSVPTLETSALGSVKCAGTGRPLAIASTNLHPRETAPKQTMSSDDFGSVDEKDMLAASELTKNASQPTASRHDDQPVICDHVDHTDEDPITEWTDTRTKQVFQVNTRTGVALPLKPKETLIKRTISSTSTPVRLSAASNSTMTAASTSLSLSRCVASTFGSRPHNNSIPLPGFLKDWRNPIFARQSEEQIPVACLDGPGVNILESAAKQRCSHDAVTKHFSEFGHAGSSKLSKSALKRAKVIQQVDRKFILFTMSSVMGGEGEALVLADQHAVSERIVLEKLLADLCTPIDPSSPSAMITTNTGARPLVNVAVLEQAPRFEISAAERRLFEKHAQHFARWSILYDLSSTEVPMPASQVRQPAQTNTICVRGLPPVIVERCKLLPSLLIELLRVEVWVAEESKQQRIAIVAGHNEDPSPVESHSWVERTGHCPKGLIAMLNSRACRSAVMFNDELSVERCQELLVDLSNCSFPFMCAHGRVSMVPLVELGAGGGDLCSLGVTERSWGAELQGDEDTFVKSISRWSLRVKEADSMNETA